MVVDAYVYVGMSMYTYILVKHYIHTHISFYAEIIIYTIP